MSTIDKIVALINASGFTNAEIAQQLNLNQQVITVWKSGKSQSYKKYLYQLAELLHTTPEYLKGETDIKEKPVADDELSQNNVKFIGRNGTVIYKRVSPEFIKILESIPDTDEDL